MSSRRRCTIGALRKGFFFLFLLSISCYYFVWETSLVSQGKPIETYALKKNKVQQNLRVESKQFFLGRVIGNALPPRHDPNRTLDNIRFILENEFNDDPTVQKHWVLNRILDSNVETQLIKLLVQFNASYSRIPFVVDEYAKQHFALFDEDDGKDHLHLNEKLDLWNTKLLVSSIYDTKNLYAMSINHARNNMIDLGITSGAQWILPWDQNCYLTKAAWNKIKADLTTNTDSKYFVTWMDRLRVENQVVLDQNYVPDAWEEPQIIFHKSALARFDEGLRYGRRDKAALLVRLKVPGVWFEWGWSQWEMKRTHQVPVPDCPKPPPSTGFVIRLFSGSAMFEAQANGFHREIARADAVSNMLQSLEAQAMIQTYHYKPSHPILYNMTMFAIMPESLKQLIIVNAERAMLRSKTIRESITDLDVYKHRRWKPEQIEEDMKLQFNRMVYDTTALLFGYIVSNDEAFATKALMLLHGWFIQESTKMQPNPGLSMSADSALLVTHTIPLLIDSIRLFEEYDPERFNIGFAIHISNWMKQFLSALLEFKPRYYFKSQVYHIAMSYEIQVASIASYINDPALYRYHSDTVQSRLLEVPFTVDALRDWTEMSTLATSAGIDIWSFTAPEKPNISLLCKAYAQIILCCNGATAGNAACSKVDDVQVIYRHGWDLLAIALDKCPELNICSTIGTQAAKIIEKETLSSSIEEEERELSWLPYSKLFLTHI
ncbi:hypothetical protein THRCLA_00873 [Thraustotheca clavata]|uniref:Alginate lyase domain-containing protein n=1 Tax=Thraustotheca clavata TaxID=74557 RepID=A0A1W0AAB3_9STRA|nr:hypothetical protein THRCLA_00873 [Thraustotheca clavata]